LILLHERKGARASIYVATSPDVADVTGTHFQGTKVIKQNPIALEDDNVQRLWPITEQLTATPTTVR